MVQTPLTQMSPPEQQASPQSQPQTGTANVPTTVPADVPAPQEIEKEIEKLEQQEDEADGDLVDDEFQVGTWHGYPNYGCPMCQFLTLNGSNEVAWHIGQSHPEYNPNSE